MATNEYRMKCRGRLAFNSIFEPYTRGGNDYGCKAIELDEADVAKARALARKLMTERWNGKIKSEKQLAQYFIHDGADKQQYDGFEEGEPYFSFNSKVRPTVVDSDGRTPLDKSSGKIYSGAYCVFYFDLWAQDNENGKGINASIVGVQFWKEGEPFSGGKPMDVDDFEALEDEDFDDIPF